MSEFDRRRFIKSVLFSLAQSGGIVVAARAMASIDQTESDESADAELTPEELQERADRLAANTNLEVDEAEGASDECGGFLNGTFRNAPFGRFRNTPLGRFVNRPLGAFRNTPLGTFRNGPLGSFANGGWPNGGWGGFRNGGWPNFGWRNWW